MINTKEKNQWSHICHLYHFYAHFLIPTFPPELKATYLLFWLKRSTNSEDWSCSRKNFLNQSVSIYVPEAVILITAKSAVVVAAVYFLKFVDWHWSHNIFSPLYLDCFIVVLTLFKLRDLLDFETIYNISFYSCHNNNKGVNNLISGVNEKNVWFCQTT